MAPFVLLPDTTKQQRELRPELQFDANQFLHAPKASSIETELSFNDISRMHHYMSGKPRCRWIPEWAFDDDKMQAVILQRGLSYSRPCRCIKARTEALETYTMADVKKWCDACFQAECDRDSWANNEKQDRIFVLHKLALIKAGGYLEFLATLLYMAYRLGYDSPTIAKELCTTPAAVRENLYRCCQVAERLGLCNFKAPHWSKGRKRSPETIALWKEASGHPKRSEKERAEIRRQARKRGQRKAYLKRIAAKRLADPNWMPRARTSWKDRIGAVMFFVAEGYRKKEIAAMFGVSDSAIRQAIRFYAKQKEARQ